MYRRTFFLVAPLLALFSPFAQPSSAATLSDDSLKAGLHTATPEEDGFIHHVIDMVDNGRLPVSLVQSTFLWARQKPKNQFQYFKRALIYRAARLGITV